MNKRVCFVIVILFSFSFCLFAKSNSSKKGDTPISLFNNVGNENNILVISNRVNNGVVNVMAAELKKIKPKNVFFKGVVTPVEDYTVSFTRKGIVDSIIGKGTYVFGRVVDANGKVIRKGSVIATLNKEDLDQQRKDALKQKELVEMSHNFAKKMTQAKQNLAKRKIITSFDLEQTQMSMHSSSMSYEAMIRKLNELLLSSKDPNVYSTHSGLVEQVFANAGNKVTKGSSTVAIRQMDPILIKIKAPVDLLNLTNQKEAALIFPNANTPPITGMIELKAGDPNNLYVHVSNRIVVSPLTTRDKGLPKVFSVFPVKKLFNDNLESFYLLNHKRKSNPLVMPTISLRHDDKGDYVYKIKDFSLPERGRKIPKHFQIERVPISLGEITATLIYGIDKPEMVRSIIDNGKIKAGDVLVGNAQSLIKNGDNVVLLGSSWEFYPDQEVKVQISAMTKQGLYVPRKAVMHQGEGEDYVYLLQHGVAKLKKVNVLGAYQEYCLISGKDVASGARAIIMNDPVLFTLLYDGSKVNIVETEGAPVFMGKDHAIDLGWASEKMSESNGQDLREKSGESGNLEGMVGKFKKILDMF